jgi:hypothetical protein
MNWSADKSQRRIDVQVRYPLVSYCIIAYAGSWLVVLPYLRS